MSADLDADVLIVGAGIAGLSAALEAARGGGEVRVLDMSSVFGGHAVVAHGGLCIIGSPIQAENGIADTPAIAYQDFIDWGEDADPAWVRYYVDHSREQIYDWLTAMGVEFQGLSWIAGNSVPRFHNVRGRGLGLVTPIYQECLKSGRVSFQWNMRVDELLGEDGRVVGVRATSTRSEESAVLRAAAIVIATGGFQSNLDKVREYWRKDLPFPERILAGSGWHSQGSGLELAEGVGARLYRLDHQWNYVTGLPDPRYPEGIRGVNVLHNDAIWVNLEGKR
ncbi:MAG: FAD-dependent oxidoreductase, partial [Acidobacteriota bacterium]